MPLARDAERRASGHAMSHDLQAVQALPAMALTARRAWCCVLAAVTTVTAFSAGPGCCVAP